MVFFTLPQAANTAATASGSLGSFFAAGSASTIVSAATDRRRPFTHHESPTVMPGSCALRIDGSGAPPEKAGTEKCILIE